MRQCKAFDQTDAIPDEIWKDEYEHTEPFPGDGGVMFEVLPEFSYLISDDDDESGKDVW